MVRISTCVPVLLVVVASGCSSARFGGWPGGQTPGGLAVASENPIFVPTMDREFLWNQVVDAMDDDFRIEREQRMQAVGGVVTEGVIETFPTTGATILEPWHGDSTWGFHRNYATLQSIRRRASVRVAPTQGGYLVGVAVTTELEDLARPEKATAGSILLREDNSLADRRRESRPGPSTAGWIPMGRDTSLEQKLLADIRDRLSHLGPLPCAGGTVQ